MKRRPVRLNPQERILDKKLLLVVLGLVVFGLIMVGDSSIIEAERNFADKFYYLKQQIIWTVIGLLGLSALTRFSHQRLKRLALPIFLVNLLLLILVIIPGIGISALGARRWLGFAGFVIQPAEFIKLSLALYLARILSVEAKDSDIQKIIPFLFSLGAVLVLVMLEPDLGTALIIGGMSTLVFFASGAPLIYFLVLLIIGVLGILVLIVTSDYRRQRLLSFLNPTSDPLGASYHIRQVLIALGSGGILGVGLGQSRQKYLFLPETQTDSIFAVIGEELGFLGAVAVVAAFVFIVWRGFLIASNVDDDFSKLLAVGITSWIALQAFINLGAMVALFPLTGIPLPFISYGGSSLVSSLLAVGILLNISKSRKMESSR